VKRAYITFKSGNYYATNFFVLETCATENLYGSQEPLSNILNISVTEPLVLIYPFDSRITPALVVLYSWIGDCRRAEVLYLLKEHTCNTSSDTSPDSGGHLISLHLEGPGGRYSLLSMHNVSAKQVEDREGEYVAYHRSELLDAP